MGDSKQTFKESEGINYYICLFSMICSVINIIYNLYNIFTLDFNSDSFFSKVWIYLKLIISIILIILSFSSIYYLFNNCGEKVSKKKMLSFLF